MTHNELIDRLGGTTAVARLLGIKAPSVHAWRTGGIPDDKLIRLAPIAEKRGVARRQDLRPDDWHLIWPEIADEQCCCAHVSSHSGDSIEAQSIDEAATAPHLS